MTKKQLADLCRKEISATQPEEPISFEGREHFELQRKAMLEFSDDEVIDVWLNTCGCGATMIDDERKLEQIIKKSRSIKHCQFLVQTEVIRLTNKEQGHKHLMN